MSKSKKTILTEDVFNSNGNSKVSSKVLNESKETIEETKEDDKSIEHKDDLENEVQKEIKEEIIESTTNKDKIIVHDKKEKQSKYVNNKTYLGFNDEIFYC